MLRKRFPEASLSWGNNLTQPASPNHRAETRLNVRGSHNKEGCHGQEELRESAGQVQSKESWRLLTEQARWSVKGTILDPDMKAGSKRARRAALPFWGPLLLFSRAVSRGHTALDRIHGQRLSWSCSGFLRIFSRYTRGIFAAAWTFFRVVWRKRPPGTLRTFKYRQKLSGAIEPKGGAGCYGHGMSNLTWIPSKKGGGAVSRGCRDLLK